MPVQPSGLSPSDRAATCRCTRNADRSPLQSTAPLSHAARWPWFVAFPPRVTVGNVDRSGRSPSENGRLVCPGPSGSHQCRWNERPPVDDEPGPTPQTTPPNGRRTPSWSERSGPFPAKRVGAPNGPGIPSSLWSRAACPGSRGCARLLPRAPRIPLVAAGRKSGTRFPTVARIASAVLPVDHTPGRPSNRWSTCLESLDGTRS